MNENIINEKVNHVYLRVRHANAESFSMELGQFLRLPQKWNAPLHTVYSLRILVTESRVVKSAYRHSEKNFPVKLRVESVVDMASILLCRTSLVTEARSTYTTEPESLNDQNQINGATHFHDKCWRNTRYDDKTAQHLLPIRSRSVSKVLFSLLDLVSFCDWKICRWLWVMLIHTTNANFKFQSTLSKRIDSRLRPAANLGTSHNNMSHAAMICTSGLPVLITAPTVDNVSCNELYVSWPAWSPDVDIGSGFNGTQLVISSYR